jgi:hypothetical protein
MEQALHVCLKKAQPAPKMIRFDFLKLHVRAAYLVVEIATGQHD